MDILGGRSVVALGNHEVLPALDQVDAEITRLQALRLQLISRAEESGLPQELGARDTVELLTLRHRRDRPEAWRDVRLARALPRYGAVATTLAEGIDAPDGTRLLQTAHASAIITELERVRTRVPVEDLDVAEQQLVSLATHLTPKELRTAAKQLCNLLDSDGPEPEEQKAYERESLTLTTAENGVKFRGYLANENAELLRAVIHTGARPHRTVDGEHDPRARDKRQADALTTALTVASNAWDTDTVSHGAKANITVTIDLDDLKSATANATGQTTYGDDLSAATIRRLACDANVIPLVLGSNSEPLDVGRRERLVTRAMRHALIARDHGCVVCAAPPVMCDAHHLTSWLDGGPTAIDNLALLCRRHHVDLHAGRWLITITNGHPHVARPPWATPSPPTPNPTQPQANIPPEPQPPDPKPPHLTPADTPPHPTLDHAPPRPTPGSDSPPPAPADTSPRSASDRARPRSDLAAAQTAGPQNDWVDPWAGTDAPAARTRGVRPSRWKADEATLAEAARFAVWGDTTSPRRSEPRAGPPPFATL
ncbi:DUF222 domain-containing protein [Kribbella sp. WER1]